MAAPILISGIMQFGLFVLLASLFLPNCNAITIEQRETINKGIQAGKDLTSVLSTAKRFGDVLDKLSSTISPWIEGIGMFGELIGFFPPEDNEMLEEMKKGFMEINNRLESIKDKVTHVKDAIDWATVKVKFDDIETNIRLLDLKLREVHIANNTAQGKVEYVKIYEDHYDEAGLKLYDAIVFNDQVFSKNILTAGRKYTDYTRSSNNDFMKGLIALMMKSSNIELSYEKFKGHDQSMDIVWKLRLNQCHEAMTKADTILQNAWANLFRGEVDKIAKEMKGAPHDIFRDYVFYFLNKKYFWRYWMVLSFGPCGGWSMYALSSMSHHRTDFYGRNFAVATSDSSRQFDVKIANSYAQRDYTCPSSSTSDCYKRAARYLRRAAPFYGVFQTAIKFGCGWAWNAPGSRRSYGTSYLRRGSWKSKAHIIIYFG